MILANSMFVVFFSGIAGSIKHHFNKNFFLKPVLIIGVTSMLCSVSATYLINNTAWYNKRTFTVIFILITGYIAYQFFFLKEERDYLPPEDFPAKEFFLIGAVGGIMLALAGVGSGVTMILIMIKMLRIDIKKATAISLGVVTITALVTATYAFFIRPMAPIQHLYTYGLIVLPMVVPTAVGCLLFAPLGVSLARKLPHKAIRLMFALFLTAAILKMIHSLWH